MQSILNSSVKNGGERQLHKGYILDVSDRSIVTLKGKDGQDLLQRLSTNDVANLTLGGVAQTILTNEKGKIIDVLSVLKLNADTLLLVGVTQRGTELRSWLEKYIIMEDAAVEEANSRYMHLLLYGIGSDTIQIHSRVKEPSRFDVRDQGGQEVISFLENFGNTKLAHLLFPYEQKEKLLSELQQEGYQVDSREGFTQFRVEHGIPAYPNELSSLYNPIEAGLVDLISFTKGCYIGQEVIARLDTYKKVQKKLVQLELGARPAETPIPIIDEKEEVGSITTVAPHGPNGPTQALGYIKTSVIEKISPLFFLKGTQANTVKIKS